MDSQENFQGFYRVENCFALHLSVCIPFYIRTGEECFNLKVSQNKWTFWEWFVDGQECVTCQIVQPGPLERLVGVGSWFTTLVALCLRLLCEKKIFWNYVFFGKEKMVAQ